MFGYVNINKDNLSKENYNVYQSYYCGLCHVLKDFSGFKGQALLNYDMTFLIVLLTGLYELNDKGKRFVCPLHPTKKRDMRINEATEYAADMNVLLSYQNFADDWKDDRAYSKKILMGMFKKEYARIFEKYPRQSKAIECYMEKLEQAERNYMTNVDAVAGLTGEMLAEIFAWKDEMWSEDLRCLGFYLGKFIYLMDAYEDIDKDRKLGKYNVLAQTRADNKEDFDTIVKLMLISMMSECARAFERMPVLEHAELVRNILYSGVWTKFEFIQMKKEKKAGKKETKSKSKKEKKKIDEESV